MPSGLFLWSGINGKAIERIGLVFRSSVIHERFQTWGRRVCFENILKAMLHYYHRQARMHWTLAIGGSKAVAAPLGGGGTVKTLRIEPNWAANYILVDQTWCLFLIVVTGANENDNGIRTLILSILLKRPATDSICVPTKPMNSWGCHLFVKQTPVHSSYQASPPCEWSSGRMSVRGEYRYPARPLGGGTNPQLAGQA